MFVLGSGELLVVGVLNRIAADFQVSIPLAGHLVTVYALGLAIGGPILTALTIRMARTREAGRHQRQAAFQLLSAGRRAMARY